MLTIGKKVFKIRTHLVLPFFGLIKPWCRVNTYIQNDFIVLGLKITFFSFDYFLIFRSTNATSCGDQSPPGFIGKVESGVGAAVAGVYSRVPYDSWPFNAMSGAHTGIKPDVSPFFYIFN